MELTFGDFNWLTSKLLYKEKEFVLKFLKENKYRFRIIKEDGVNFMITHDFDRNRCNLVFRKEKLTDLTSG